MVNNYLPLSILPPLCNILEKVVLTQLWDYLQDHHPIHQAQSAYKPLHSTETTLFRVTSDKLSAPDGGDACVLSLLDLSATFDHSLLLQRLRILYGISGPALAWFNSYLTDRTQTVKHPALLPFLVRSLKAQYLAKPLSSCISLGFSSIIC